MKTKTKLDAVDRFLAMSDAERDADVARHEKPIRVGRDGLPGKPLPAKMREQWENSKVRRRGRQKVGRGAVRVLVTVEAGLLERADNFAESKGLKRAELFGAALRSIMDDGNKLTVSRREDGAVLLVQTKVKKSR